MKAIIIQFVIPIFIGRKRVCSECTWHEDCEVISAVFWISLVVSFCIVPAIPKAFNRLKKNISKPAQPRYWETINSNRTDDK